MRMPEVEVQEHARQLFDVLGARAVAKAAKQASRMESQGDSQEAETWRRIERALKMMNGPHQS
jgi:hypothetical protein